MKKLLTLVFLFSVAKIGFSQIVISGFLPNPAGTDSAYEYVQLVATQNINFSTNPYTVVFLNNGLATTKGWVNGNNISYGFYLNSGSVNRGDVFYVGGSAKRINGLGSTDMSGLTWIRTINIFNTAGDGFGAFAASGVLGNGGANADGIGVFSGQLTSTDSTASPIDCIFYGTGVGTAKPVTVGAGYRVPTNDKYSSTQGLFGEGTNTYLAFDGSIGGLFTKLNGTFNTTQNQWTTSRTWDTVRLATTTATSAIATGITIASSSPTIALNTNGFTNDFGLNYPNIPSSASNFIFSGSNLTDSVTISVNAPFEIRVGVNNFASGSIKLANAGGTITTTVLDVRYNPTAIGTSEDTVYFTSSGAETKKVYVKGTASNNPSLSFKTTSFSISEAGGNVTLQVNIANANLNPTSVDIITLAPSTATAGSDYTFTSPQRITFPANSKDSITITIPIINDLLPEGNEKIWFGFSNSNNGAIYGTNDSVEVTIVDNDYRKVNIASIRGVNSLGEPDSLNKLYEISGVVYGPNQRTPGFQFTVRDQTGGIGIFSPANAFGYTPAQGDSLILRGRLSQFRGLAQLDFLDTIIFIQSNKTLKLPTVVTALGENTESDLVRMNNVTTKPGAWIAGNQFIYFNNGADSVLVRIAPSTNNLIGKSKPTKVFSIVGIGGQFDATSPLLEGYQLFPRDSADIIVPFDSLSNFSLLLPANNRRDTIRGATTQTISITWEPSLPAPGLIAPTYTVLFDEATGDFSTPLASFPANVGGTATALSLPFLQALNLLNSQNIQVGQSLSLLWTVRATTTNNYSKLASQPFSITFIRDRMNSVNGVNNIASLVYPNPATSSVSIQATEPIISVSIYTVDGKIIAAQKGDGSKEMLLATANINNGMYILRVETASGVASHRLAIQQ